jgi:importin subunit beta-1
MDLTAVLQAAQSSDPAHRANAEETIKQQGNNNFAPFLVLLSAELSNESKPTETRVLAGILLKNAVYSDDEARAAERAAKWAAVDAASKSAIRAALLATLSSAVRCAPAGTCLLAALAAPPAVPDPPHAASTPAR